MGIRWLSDGMESGMTAVAAIALGFLSSRISGDLSTSKALPSWLYLAVGFGTVLLRIEFLYAVAIVTAAWTLRMAIRFARSSPDEAPPLNRAACVWLLASGALLAALVEWQTFGHLLPDTAIAKAASGLPIVSLSSLFGFAAAVGRAHLGSSFFGVATPVALALSGIALLSTTREKAFAIVVNTGVPLFFLLVFLRQQAVQGYRYFISVEFFVLAFNLYSLEAEPGKNAEPVEVRRKWPIVVIVCILLAWISYDLGKLKLITDGRAAGWETFASMRPGFLKARRGVAWDVGMVGFFTDGYILDPNGLVNGRKAATLSPEGRRSAICKRSDIEFVFANSGQLDQISQCLNLSGWRELGRFDFPNFNGLPDTHLLLVSPKAMRDE
jgi:hypothetical protein